MSWLGALYCTPLTVKMAYLLGHPGVEALHDLLDERLVAGAVVEAARAAQAKCLVDGGLQRVVARLDRAVLVRLPGVAAAGAHAVVAAQVFVAPRELLLLGQVVERRRQAVGAVFLGHATQAPQRRLQPGGQRQEALAFGDDDGVPPARVRQCELVQPVIEGDAVDHDAEVVGDGEVRQAEPARRMLLRKEDVALGAVHGSPLSQAPLQRAQHAGVVLAGMAALQFLQQRDGVQLRVGLQQRHDFGIPYGSQRVVARAPAS